MNFALILDVVVIAICAPGILGCVGYMIAMDPDDKWWTRILFGLMALLLLPFILLTLSVCWMKNKKYVSGIL